MTSGEKSGFLEDKLEPGAPVTDDNAFVLSLIPYEETTTYRKGTANAPEAIIDASGHVELFDETLKFDASRHGILTIRPEITNLDSITRHARSVRERYPDALHGFLGGEHSVTAALIEGVAEEGMGIVWIDAHTDLRKSFYGRPDSHACAGYNSLPFGPMVQIGIRCIAEEEWRLIEESDRVQVFQDWGEEARRALLDLPERVYMTVDFDGFAPEVVRAVGTPEPGGLYWSDMMEILDTVFASKQVIAYDAVELCPTDSDHASSFIAARLVYKIMTLHAHYRLGG